MKGKLKIIRTDSQNDKILKHLQKGFSLTVEEARELGFGSNLRSRISNLHEAGYKIKHEKIQNSKNYHARYSMPDYVKARREIEASLKDNPTPFLYLDIETIYLDKNNSYKFSELDLCDAAMYLKSGFIAIPF